MGFEVDFLPVGSRYQSGDAIAVRWGRPGAYKVLLYDGGTTDSGRALVAHVRERYRSSHVDYVVSSHPDGDHASGLAVVLKRLQVGELWMHRPWTHSAALRSVLAGPRRAGGRLRSKLRAACRLEAEALQRGVAVHEPFQGMRIGAFQVLSPSQSWYLGQLLPAFGQATPSAVPPGPPAVETWDLELLDDSATTSPDNEASVILWAEFGGQGVLLTGDAGTQALNHAIDWAQAQHLPLTDTLSLLQVPHHGNCHHVSPAVLDRLLGPRKAQDDGRFTTRAFISAGAGSHVHPHPWVINALLRRGAAPFATRGQRLSHGAMHGKTAASLQAPLPFQAQVDLG